MSAGRVNSVDLRSSSLNIAASGVRIFRDVYVMTRLWHAPNHVGGDQTVVGQMIDVGDVDIGNKCVAAGGKHPGGWRRSASVGWVLLPAV